MKNGLEKVKNIEIPGLFREPLLAGIGNGGGGGLDALKDAYQYVTGINQRVKHNLNRNKMEEETKEIYEKAMRNAAGNLPDYNKKPIMPRQYKRKVYNEDGTSTYTFVSKRNGKEYDVKYDKEGFPLFNSKEEMLLDKSFYLEPDKVQFRELSLRLYEKIQRDQDLALKFTPSEIEYLKRGKVPKTLTWHHHQDPGRMQIVDFFEHDAAPHTGGRAIWGGGVPGRKGHLVKQILEGIVTWKK